MRNRWIAKADEDIIHGLRIISAPLARFSIFIIFFWFGALKIFGESPANPLVEELLKKTLPLIGFEGFIIFFGIYEMAIGAAFLFRHYERLAIAFLIPHLLITALPLFALPAMTWQGILIPTLEGQYIIKNLVIVALAIGLGARLRPMKPRS